MFKDEFIQCPVSKIVSVSNSPSQQKTEKLIKPLELAKHELSLIV